MTTPALPYKLVKPYILPKPRPEKRSVTVCIAAICEGAKRIVAVCDQQVTTGSWSADNQAVKGTMVALNWWLMWSASDVTKIPPILTNMKNMLWGENRSVEDVTNALCSAYQKQIRQEAENQYLSRFGMTMESFLADGVNQLTAQSFDLLRERIDSITLGCELMTFGFDKMGSPHIITLRDPGTVSFCNPHSSSFAAIGSGALRAESTLYFHGVSWKTPCALGLYHVCEAKFMSESALGVGPSTLGIVMQSEGGLVLLSKDVINKIRKFWEKRGKSKVHQTTSRFVSEIINGAIEENKPTRSSSPT